MLRSGAFHPNGTLFVICGNGHEIIHTTDATAAPWEAEWSERPLKLSPQGEEGEWEGATPLWFWLWLRCFVGLSTQMSLYQH